MTIHSFIHDSPVNINYSQNNSLDIISPEKQVGSLRSGLVKAGFIMLTFCRME